jgi:DNA-binding NtrC family response regulator
VSPGEFDDLEGLSTALRPRPSSAGGTFILTVTEGPDQGKTFALDESNPSSVLLGQSEACEVRLSDRSVSRRHAALEVTGGKLRVTDLGSSNGTSIQGLSIVDAFCSGGELLRVGTTALRVEVRASIRAPELTAATSFGLMIGASAAMRRLYPLCSRLAASNVPVLIEGETGTGKEALAESLHAEGSRASGPYVVFDCTSVPANLLESELFGHERGAFTGAVASRKGVFERANGGTLLIDEIGDMDPILQPKLLRVLERAEVQRLGGSESFKVDVRVLAATRRDLDREVQSGRFRDDLFHRLVVARVELPPLRRRKGDVALLARHFARLLGGEVGAIGDGLLARWEDLPWPGNVRELRNAVARHLALGELATLGPLPDDDRAQSGEALPSAAVHSVAVPLAMQLPLAEARQRAIDQFDRSYVKQVLAHHGGNVTRAAEAAGVAKRYFQLLKAKYSGST